MSATAACADLAPQGILRASINLGNPLLARRDGSSGEVFGVSVDLASELARRSDEPPAVLRQRVTSKGGTTYAAITHMQEQKLPEHFIEAMRKAQVRAQELAAEFGK